MPKRAARVALSGLFLKGPGTQGLPALWRVEPTAPSSPTHPLKRNGAGPWNPVQESAQGHLQPQALFVGQRRVAAHPGAGSSGLHFQQPKLIAPAHEQIQLESSKLQPPCHEVPSTQPQQPQRQALAAMAPGLGGLALCGPCSHGSPEGVGWDDPSITASPARAPTSSQPFFGLKPWMPWAGRYRLPPTDTSVRTGFEIRCLRIRRGIPSCDAGHKQTVDSTWTTQTNYPSNSPYSLFEVPSNFWTDNWRTISEISR